MRYTVISPETEERIASVDRLEAGTDSSWEVFGTEDAKQLFKGARVSLDRGTLEVVHAGRRFVYPVVWRESDRSILVATPLGNFRLAAVRGASAGVAGGARGAQKAVKSSMPGRILKLLCEEGQVIEAGQPVLIIEAMKMENEVRAPQAGKLEKFAVKPGQSVQSGELLFTLGQPA